MKRACVTGHRYIVRNKPNNIAVNHLIDLALRDGIEQFYVGMSRGADFLFAEILSERKLNWVAIIPCISQTHLWNKTDKNKHKFLVDKAEDMIILHDEYKKGVMHYRNRYMIDNSQLLLAMYDDCRKGGTAHTVGNAILQNKKVIQFNPHNHQFNIIESRQLSLNLF